MMNSFKFSLLFFFAVSSLDYVANQRVFICNATASCGCSPRPAVLSRIVGGEDASNLTWNWAVSLRLAQDGSHFCGGSIIAASYVLTAAHCTVLFTSPTMIRVHLGSIYSNVPTQVRNVSKIINHPSYDGTTFLNDISILKLSSPLNLNLTTLDKVCLPNVSSSFLATSEYPMPGTDLVAIGWGIMAENATMASPLLQQVTVQAIAANSTYCRNASLIDSKTQFCAGSMPSGGKDTCQGDSGGPIMIFTSANTWEQVGVVSNGIGCARPELPGIYTRVAAYQSWINATINSANRFTMIPNAGFISILLLLYF